MNGFDNISTEKLIELKNKLQELRATKKKPKDELVPSLKKEWRGLKGFATFPYDIAKELVVPTWKGVLGGDKQKIIEAGEKADVMGKTFGGGVGDWLLYAFSGDPKAKAYAQYRIQQRQKEAGYVAETAHPLALVAGVKGAGKVAGKFKPKPKLMPEIAPKVTPKVTPKAEVPVEGFDWEGFKPAKPKLEPKPEPIAEKPVAPIEKGAVGEKPPVEVITPENAFTWSKRTRPKKLTQAEEYGVTYTTPEGIEKPYIPKKETRTGLKEFPGLTGIKPRVPAKTVPEFVKSKEAFLSQIEKAIEKAPEGKYEPPYSDQYMKWASKEEGARGLRYLREYPDKVSFTTPFTGVKYEVVNTKKALTEFHKRIKSSFPTKTTELYSGFPVPQLIKNFYNEAIKPKISAPEGVEVSGVPQGLALAHSWKLPQNVFANHPIGKDIVFLLRQTERGLQYDTQININRLKPIGSLPKQSRIKLGQAGRVKELTQKDLHKYSPKEQEAIIAHREMMDSYRKQLYNELKASGRPMPEKYTDWGLDEYMHHLFRGNWKIIDRGRITEGGFAVTYADAIKKVKAYIAENPTAKPSISFEHIFPKDALVYLTPKHRARLFAELAKKTELTWEEVRNAVAGKVVAMKPKKRYAGQTLHRKADLGGWAEDLYEVDRFYIASTERFLKWNKFRRESQRLYNKIPPEQDIIRREIKTLLDQSEAPPSVTELNIDAKLINNSLTRPFARPFFLRRAIGKVTNLEAVFKIGNPRFWVQNSTQTLTTVYPVVGERLYLKAVKDFFTPEGQRLLHENKVYPEKIVWTQKDIWDFRSRFTNGILKVGGEIEKYNHGVAFLSQYYRMLEKGAKPEIAIGEALNFVDRTQFPSTIGNLPGVFRSLPIWTKPFTQFKPFAVRYLENTVIPRAIDLMKLKAPGFRFAGMWMLTGGLRLVTSPFAWATGIFGYKLYNEIKKKYGKKVADLIYYGIPGLLGADISGSLAINLMTGYGDIYSQIGQTALGPAGSDVVKAGKVVLGIEKPETLTEISPLIKAPVEVGKAIKGEELVESAYTGRPQYRVSRAERLLRATGIMPKGQTTQRLELQEAKKILRDYREKRTEIVQGVTKAILGGDEKALDKFINEAVKWNEKHPTIPIVFGAEQIKDEILKQHLTPMERMLYLDLSKKRSMGLQEEMGQ